jgi:choice-of-anchor C domain-containing protein
MKNLVIFAAVTLILIGATVRPISSQVVNGSFETGHQDPGQFWIILGTGSTMLDPWFVSSGGVDYIGLWWQASDGVKSVDMNSAAAGQIRQIVATAPGTTYGVAFDMSGNPDPVPPAVKLMTVTADGGQAVQFAYDVSQAGNTRPDMRWSPRQYTFTAVGNSTELAFTSNVGGSAGPVLDNVRVVALEGVCHRNNGKKGQKTLMVSPSAVPAHLAHGDTQGPCPES